MALRRVPHRAAVLAAMLGLVLLVVAAAVGADELEVEQALDQWSVDPLDLRRASADEIALLPWISPAEAEAIETLAAADQIGRLEDLLRVPGMEPAQLAAIAPFVLPTRAPSGAPLRWTASLRGETRVDPGSAPYASRRVMLESDRFEVAFRDAPSGERLAHGSVLGPAWSLRFGRLRTRSASPLLLADSAGRTRSGLLPLHSRQIPRAAGTLSTTQEGRAVALAAERGPIAAIAYVADGGPTRRWLEVHLMASGASWSVAAAESDRGRAEGLFQVRRPGETFSSRLDVAGARGRWRSFVQMRWTPPSWRVTASFTRSDADDLPGRDPISLRSFAHRLRAWQLGLRHADETKRWTLYLRRLERPSAAGPEAVHRLRLELDPRRATAAGGRWHLRLGLDEQARSADEPFPARSSMDLDLLASWQDRWGPLRRRLRLWFRGQRGHSSRALAVDLRSSGSWDLRAALAVSSGSRSHPWAWAVPAGGVRVKWLQPDQPRLVLGLGRRSGGAGWGWRWGAWFSTSWSSRTRPTFEGGWALVLDRAGAKVAPAAAREPSESGASPAPRPQPPGVP